MNREHELRLKAQIALLGEVPASLRSVSIAAAPKAVSFRAILTTDASEGDREALSCAATEFIAQFDSDTSLNEQIICYDGRLEERELPLLVYRRKE